MNLIDAIKSGRPYRRQGCRRWNNPQKCEYLTVRLDDLLADDWEIDPLRLITLPGPLDAKESL